MNQHETADLPPDQSRVAALLAGGETIRSAAKIASVGERTIFTWMKDEAFRNAIAEVRGRILNAAIGKLTSRKIIKAIKVGSLCDIQGARVYEDEADLLLFDAQAAPIPEVLPGGNGLSFDWRWLQGAVLRRGFMLAGGLRIDNVLTALGESGASAVDVSSGVESSPGVKDPTLIRQFIKTAKSFEAAGRISTAAE